MTDKHSHPSEDLSKKALLEQLPLLANGSLPESERTSLQAQIQNQPELEQELALLQAMRAGLREDDSDTPGEFGLARLKRSIDKEKQKDQTPPSREAPGPTSTRRNYWKGLALAACCLFAGQTYVFTVMNTSDPATGTVPLAGGTQVQQGQLQVVFDDTASVADMNQALQSIKAQVIAGPGTFGIYTLALPEGQDLAQAETRLKAYESVVEVNPL